MHVQLGGHKYVRLYAPRESPRLYPDSAPSSASDAVDGSQGNFSAVDVLSPDAAARFPLFAEAAFVDAVLGPGDALYIPYGWWHACEALTTSVSANWWFDRPHAQLVAVLGEQR